MLGYLAVFPTEVDFSLIEGLGEMWGSSLLNSVPFCTQTSYQELQAVLLNAVAVLDVCCSCIACML